MKRIVFGLLGPTATGKTDLAIALAADLPIDIISVDSAMIYRGMDIGTAKPSRAIRDRVPHYLIDILEPNEQYSAQQFCQAARLQIAKSFATGRVPLLVGGTMLYFRALTHGLARLPASDPELRTRIQQQAEQQGWPALHQQLAALDPAMAARLKPHDKQRITRALEVWQQTGQSLTEHWQRQTTLRQDWTYQLLGLLPEDRVALHARIAKRWQAILQAGLVAELRDLLTRYSLNETHPALRCVGYRQAYGYLQGHCTYHEFAEKGLVATRQLAKRQMTWLRHWEDLCLLPSENPDLYHKIKALLTKSIT